MLLLHIKVIFGGRVLLEPSGFLLHALFDFLDLRWLILLCFCFCVFLCGSLFFYVEVCLFICACVCLFFCIVFLYFFMWSCKFLFGWYLFWLVCIWSFRGFLIIFFNIKKFLLWKFFKKWERKTKKYIYIYRK